jgi:acyl-CoA synthetase (AMP-forming)/AMP-acid ligase II
VELIGFCRERLANFKVPRVVRVVDALPRNASGKVLKYELRNRQGTPT